MRNTYGWFMVGISMLLLLLTVGPTSYAFGLFVLPVSEDLGLTRANINTGLILLNFGMAALAPFVGRMLDRTSIRLTMGLSAALFAGGFAVLALSRNMWLSAAMLCGPLAIGVLGLGTLSTTALVARWFPTQRARALAIAAIGISLGSVIAVPLIGLLIAELGWRQALLVEAVVIAVLAALVLPFIRERSVSAGNSENAGSVAANEQAPGADTPITTARLLASPVFWTISTSLGLGFGVLQTIVVSLAPYAQEHGIPIGQAASLISIYGGMAIAGKIALAGIGDRIDRVSLLAVLFGIVALSAAAPLLSQGYWALLLCSAVLGTAAGATTPAFSALLADRFGAASIGTSYGLASTVVAVISAACIRFGGEAYDRTGSYDLMFISFAALAALAAAIMAATKPVLRLQAASRRNAPPALR